MMAPLFFFALFALFHPVHLYTPEEEREFHEKKCLSFRCLGGGETMFPYRNATAPDFCGPFVVEGCDRDVQIIELEKGGRRYEVKSISQGNTISLTDKDLKWKLENRSCQSFNSLGFPNLTYAAFHITSKNLTMFKCEQSTNNRPDELDYLLNYTQCEGFNIYYTKSNENLPSPPPNCSIILLPGKVVHDKRSYGDIFGLLTANFTLDVGFVPTCYWCSLEGGTCSPNRNGQLKCIGGMSSKKGNRKLGWKLGVGGLGLGFFAAITILLLFYLQKREHNLVSANTSSDTCTKGNPRLDLTIGLGLGGSLIATIALTSLCLSRKYSLISSFCSKGRGGKHDVEEFLKSYGTLVPKRFSYSEIKKITKSFREKLGKGGYGEVFKGKLPDGSLVAVKVLTKSKANGEDFINEVASIGRTSHVNIVTLLGFCFEGSKRALIYEFMSGGSLEKYIYGESYSNDDRQLGWETLLDIAIGIARGLEYLHRGCNTRILHFDIKPHNILLDENFCPKVSDFGLAKICPQRESIISMVGARGTAGYIAPEVFCRNFGGVSHKSDVYSYGMMVFEMVGGRKNIHVEVENSSEIYFPHWIHKRLELGEDLGLCGTRNVEERQIAKKMILVSLWCIQTNPSDRPAVDRVVEMLQGSLESIPIPPKPYLSSPSGSPQISVSSSPSTSILTGQISEQVIKEVMG